MTLSWTGDSLNKLVEQITFTDDQIKDLVDELLQALGKRLHELIFEKSPKDKGDYAEGWKLNDVQGNEITITNPDGKKFTILEFTGKRQTHIEAKPGKVLHFVIDGKDIFVKFSNPGAFGPEPHVRPALEQLGREALDIMLKIIKTKFPAFS